MWAYTRRLLLPRTPRRLLSSAMACGRELDHPILAVSQSSEAVYSDFSSLMEMLRSEITDCSRPQSPEKAARITRMLSAVRLNPKEWGQYTNFAGAHYTRTMVGYDPNFVLLLLSWERDQMSPIHCHANSSCWVKVLGGQIQETIYEYPETEGPLKLKQEDIYEANQATYIDDSYGVHKMGNPRSDQATVSLHVYASPYSSCNLFERATGAKTYASLGTVYDSKPAQISESQTNGEASDGGEGFKIMESVHKISLDTFVERVQAELRAGSVDSKAVADLLEKLVLSPDEWERFVTFGGSSYTRHLLLLDDNFSIMLLCWDKGQATPPHHHGPNKKSWFKVLSGELTMTHYKDDVTLREKQLLPSSSDREKRLEIEKEFPIKEGDPICHETEDDFHALGNRSADSTAVSIHLYSPPYLQLDYESTKGEKKKLPVVHHGKMFEQIHYTSDKSTGCEIFSNFHAYKSLLDLHFGRHKGNPDSSELHTTITSLMSQIQINPEEWKAQVRLSDKHFTRILIGQSSDWVLILTCWDKDQGTPIHDHQGSYNWIKVLEGQLLEENYDLRASSANETKEKGAEGEKQYEEAKVDLIRSGILPPDSVTFLNKSMVHRIRNVSSKPAFSLHLYSPPYKRAKAYDMVSGSTNLVFLPQKHVQPSIKGMLNWSE